MDNLEAIAPRGHNGSVEATGDERLVGLWSADARYGPGAQSDETLWFRADGTGRRDFVNFALCTVEFFGWEAMGPDQIFVTWDRVLQWTDEGVEEGRQQGVKELNFTIAEEQIPAGGSAEVLRIELGGLESAFARVAAFDPASFDEPQLGL